MMYLVYTAMLALNVAAEVVAGFVTVGDAMNESNANIEVKLSDSYNLFANAYKNNPEKTKAFYDKAQEVRNLSNSLKAYLDSLQCEFLCTIQSKAVINHEGKKRTIPLQGPNGELLIDSARAAFAQGGLDVIDKKDDNHSGSRFFFGASDKATGKVVELKERVIKFKHDLKKMLGADSADLQIALNVEKPHWSTSEHAMVPWEQMNFDNTIVIADMIVLSQLKAETMNAEFDAVNKLFSQVSANDFKFDQVSAISRPTQFNIIQGGTYETHINIGAYDSKATFEATINGQHYTSDETGSITYKSGSGAPGMHTIKGTVYVKRDGGTAEYPIEDSYYVMAPIAVAEMTKMNVAYAGIENPMTVSVPGIPSKDVHPVVAEGSATLTKAGGEGNYIFRASKLGKVQIQVNATTNGVTRAMGRKEIRVKRIPAPVLKVGTFKNNDVVSKNEFLVDPTIRARLEDFDFQLPPLKITSFAFNVSGSGMTEIQGRGNKLTPDMVSRIKNARRGQKIYIDDVVVKTPDGVTHTLNAAFRIR